MDTTTLRYSWPYTLCIEALHELATQPGDARIRVKAIDPEFYSLSESDFPEPRGARQRFLELCALLGVAGTALNPSDVATTLAALTVEDAGAMPRRSGSYIASFHITWTAIKHNYRLERSRW
jgi:hypothetical protein